MLKASELHELSGSSRHAVELCGYSTDLSAWDSSRSFSRIIGLYLPISRLYNIKIIETLTIASLYLAVRCQPLKYSSSSTDVDSDCIPMMIMMRPTLSHANRPYIVVNGN